MPPYAIPAGSAPQTQPQFPGQEGLKDYYLNYTPEAGFWAYLQGKGMAGTGPQDRYAQSRYSNYYGNYLAAAADEPMLGFYDYLNRQNMDPGTEYKMQSPDQRADYSSRFLTPRARWTNLG